MARTPGNDETQNSERALGGLWRATPLDYHGAEGQASSLGRGKHAMQKKKGMRPGRSSEGGRVVDKGGNP